MDPEYSAIRVATLRGDKKIPFGIYVKVADKYILYCRSGDSFEGARLERLKSKKLKKMFVKLADEIPYKQYLEENINDAYSNRDNRPLAIRAEVIQGFQQAETESFLEDALDEFTYAHLRSSVQRFTEFVEREPESIRYLLSIPNIDMSISHHCVNVSALALAIALELGLRQGMPLHLLALGCMLHDAEHLLSGFDVSRPLTSLTPEEMTRYREHPLKGAHRMQGGSFLDQMVVSVMTQHEELMDGTGFPKGLKEKEMDPLVMVAGLANAYDRLISFEGLNHKDALKNLLIAKMGVYPLEHLQVLQKILKRHSLT